MGKAIERFALARGHEVVARIDIDNPQDFDSDAFRSADVAIEFTTPLTAAANCRKALERGVRVVSGSTGWAAAMPELKYGCSEAYVDYVKDSHGHIDDMRNFIYSHRKELDSIEIVCTDPKKRADIKHHP